MTFPPIALALWLLQPCTYTVAQSARRSHAQLARTASPQTLGLAPKVFSRPRCTRTDEPHRTPLCVGANSTIGNTAEVSATCEVTGAGSHQTRLRGGCRALSGTHAMTSVPIALAVSLLQHCASTVA
jgi:hypothetical protein